MSLSEGMRLYPKAIGQSILLSCTIIMEGYDTTLITAFFAFPVLGVLTPQKRPRDK